MSHTVLRRPISLMQARILEIYTPYITVPIYILIVPYFRIVFSTYPEISARHYPI